MKRRLFRAVGGSFTGKVLFAVLALLILLSGTFTAFSLLSQQQAFDREIVRDGRLLTSVLGENVRLGIFAKNQPQLAASMQSALGVSGVVAACVFDQNGELLERRTAPGWDKTALCREARPAAQQLAEGAMSQAVQLNGEETHEFWGAVLAKPVVYTADELYFYDQPAGAADQVRRIGSVGVVFDRKLVREGFRATLLRHALILAVFLGVGCVAAFFLVQAVTRPLDQLVGKVKARGLTVDDRDDLGLLSDTYSSMVRSLDASFATISTLQKGLEEKVHDLERENLVRRQAEAAMRESEEKFRSISEGIADGVAIIRDGSFVWANQAFCAIIGCCTTELASLEPPALLPRPGPYSRPDDAAAEDGAPERYQCLTRRRDGREILVDVKAQPMLYENRPATQIIIRDITEQEQADRQRKEMEVKALAQSKMAALGKIATGVAHEINQPLSFVRIAFESALRDLEDGRLVPTEAREYMQEALRQVGRITVITEHLRSFGRADTALYEDVQLVQVLDNSLTLMREILRLADITLERDIAGVLPQIRGNSVQLEQVFINLFQNSVDAMGRSGERRLRVAMHPAAGMIETRFSDTGPGIAPEAVAKIFQPFYSTKDLADRTGLGLAIVSSIIREHGGTIEYRQLPDWGATFVILLPAAGGSGVLGQGPDNI